MAFEAITTQDDLDRIINDRLSRDREATAKKYEGFLSPEDAAKKYDGYIAPGDVDKLKTDYETKLTDLNKSLEEATAKAAKDAESLSAKDKDIADRDAKIKGYETTILKTKIAQETGLPFGMAERLRGENEEELRKDAQGLLKLTGMVRTAPLGATEPEATKDKGREALRQMVKGLHNE